MPVQSLQHYHGALVTPCTHIMGICNWHDCVEHHCIGHGWWIKRRLLLYRRVAEHQHLVAGLEHALERLLNITKKIIIWERLYLIPPLRTHTRV